MLGGVILVMQVEGHVLQPFLLGRAVKLHPLAVVLAIAVGVIAAGIVGALLAVPLLAFTKSFVLSLAGGAEPPLGKAYPLALPLHRRQGPRTGDAPT
jgi:predicted PurR-regulated permease PerM